MSRRPLWYLAPAALLLLLLPALLVYLLNKEAETLETKKVYVDIDSLLADYSPDFLQESFNDLPSEEPIADTVADVPVELDLSFDSLYYVHDTGEFEKAVFAKLTEEKDQQFRRIMSVMDASGELAARRNIIVGLMQLNPLFEEYDAAGMEKLRSLFAKNTIESLNSQARFYASASKRRLFDTPENNTLFGEAASKARLDRQRNNQLYLYYMSVSDRFKQQEIQKTVDRLNGILERQISESRAAKEKKYESYVSSVKDLFAGRMPLDRNTTVEYYPMPAAVSPAAHAASPGAETLREPYSDADKKRMSLYRLLANMSEEMGLDITYIPEKQAPDFTEVFRRKLKDSWMFTPGLISEMEG
ncbi:MAG: hypothetical protein IK083_08705 [Abditibacteriota bacterium]|nr:hypothetical protein [Abditibacteriota bacterium]